MLANGLILWSVEGADGYNWFANRDKAVKYLEKHGMSPAEADKHIETERLDDWERGDWGATFLTGLVCQGGIIHLDKSTSIVVDDEALKLVEGIVEQRKAEATGATAKKRQ